MHARSSLVAAASICRLEWNLTETTDGSKLLGGQHVEQLQARTACFSPLNDTRALAPIWQLDANTQPGLKGPVMSHLHAALRDVLDFKLMGPVRAPPIG